MHGNYDLEVNIFHICYIYVSLFVLPYSTLIPPCPHTPPPPTFYFIFTYYRPFDDFFQAFYLIFTYHRPPDDLLALVVENKFM